ncbi:MAG: DUF4347 domain-containing protein [Desulfococcaceae bacterium]
MLNLIKLENRIVLDGAAVGEALEHAADHEANIHTENVQTQDYNAESYDVSAAAALLNDADAHAQSLDIVLVSDSLPDYQKLADAAAPGTKVIVYDADSESAEDVIGRVAALSESEGMEINSLTILSHGGAGYFELGNEAVKAENLSSFSDAWAALDAAMKDDGHIYIYGCGMANGEGLSLLDDLAEATHTRVFASDDVTGHSGDWDLEAASENAGDENPAPPINFDMLADYEGDLTKIAVPTAITSTEDQPGLFGIYIYGTGEDADSRDADSVTRTGTLPSILTNATVRYDGWITNQPITIEGVTVTEYHRWSVTYTPDEDAFTNDGTYGSAILNFKIAEENQTYSTDVTILPVNDPPDFEYSDEDDRVSIDDGTVTVTVDEDSGNNGLITIDNFATDIIAGPDNESSQKVKFIVQGVTVEIDGVEVDSSELFDVLPSISPLAYTSLSGANGDLTFTLKDNAYGTAVVSVLVQDDGGTLYGGDDTSAVKTFVINVKPVNDNPNVPEINEDWHIYEDNGDPDNSYAPTPEAGVEGFRVDEFIESVTDPDVDGEIPIAIAITDISSDMDGDGDSDGKWQFQMAGSDDWTTIEESSLSGDKALLLTADDKIRFIPNTDFNSEEPSSAAEPFLTVKSWDQTGNSDGKEGTYYSIASTDTAFSKDGVDVPLEVRAVNDAPELWKDDALMPDTDGPYKANNGTVVITDISVKDADIARGEGDKRVQVTLDAELENGTISLGSTAGLTFVTGDGTNDNKMVFTGLLSNVNAAISSLTYKYNGTVTAPITTDTVTVEVSDLGNYGVPSAKTDTALIKIDLNQGPGVGEVDEVFIEGCNAVPVTDGTIHDAEGDEIRSVTISFKDSTFIAGQDVLHYSTAAAGNILANYNSQTGTLTLTVAGGGTASESDFQKVLSTVTYENTSDTPNTVQREFNIVSVDEYGNTGTTESVISVVPVNDAPIAGMPGSISTISDTSVVISNISLGDVDMSLGFVNIVIQADHGILSIGQSAIDLIVSNGGSVSNNGTKSVTITAKLADVAPGGTLTALTYTPEAGYSGTDGIKFKINDQGYTGFFREGEIICELADELKLILDENGQLPPDPIETDGTPSDPNAQEIEKEIPVIVIPPNTPPVIDLDPDGDGGDGPDDGPEPGNPGDSPNFHVAYVEGCDLPNGVKIADTDATLIDADEADKIVSMTVTITNATAYDLLNADVSGTSITMTSYTYDSTTGKVSLHFSGADSDANYQKVLRTVTFSNTSENPVMTPRNITITAVDDHNNTSLPVTSTVYVIQVNDAPEITFPTVVGTTQDTSVILSGISVSDKDIELTGGTVQVIVSSSENSILEITHLNSVAAISGNGTGKLVIEGSLTDVNEALKDLKYTPSAGFTGDDKLTIVANDMGYSGIGRINGIESTNPDTVPNTVPEFCTATDSMTIAKLQELANESNNEAGSKNDSGIPDSPHALEDQETLIIRVAKNGPPPVEPPPQPPTPPAQPIVTPGDAELGGIPLGAVRLPGAFGLTEGPGRPSLSIRAGGEDFFDFCSLEEALKIGCRFANTRDPEAQFSAVSWDFLTDLGWTEPYLDEEFDLYSRLFLREKGDPGLNIPAGAFEIDLGGQPIQKPLVFQQGGGEDFNSYGPGELKKAFFSGRENLDRTGRGPEPRAAG